MSSTLAPSVSKIRLTFAFCSAKPNWMPRKPKLMFQISQNVEPRLRTGPWRSDGGCAMGPGWGLGVRVMELGLELGARCSVIWRGRAVGPAHPPAGSVKISSSSRRIGRCQLGRTDDGVPGRFTPRSSSQRSSSQGTTSGLSDRPSHSSSAARNAPGGPPARPSRSASHRTALARSSRTPGPPLRQQPVAEPARRCRCRRATRRRWACRGADERHVRRGRRRDVRALRRLELGQVHPPDPVARQRLVDLAREQCPGSHPPPRTDGGATPA